MSYDNNYCRHDWVECTSILKNIIKFSNGKGDDVYFNKLRFSVCRNCGQITQSIIKNDKGDLDDNNQIR